MSAPAFGTLLSGGELAGVGIKAAGWEHAWGVEIEPSIAAVAQANGFNVTVADVLDCDPRDFEPVDGFHASTVCTRASVGNQSADVNGEGTKESPLDIAMGEKVAEFVAALLPRVVTVENVWGYRKFRAFKMICEALGRCGYMWDFDHLNAADYGVPQTRGRLILRAVRGALLTHLPEPVAWAGWYAAVKDLLPTMPTSEWADWQRARLPRHMGSDFLMAGSGNTNLADAVPGGGVRWSDQPAHTVASDGGGRTPRAWLAECGRVVDITPRGLARFQSVPD